MGKVLRIINNILITLLYLVFATVAIFFLCLIICIITATTAINKDANDKYRLSWKSLKPVNCNSQAIINKIMLMEQAILI